MLSSLYSFPDMQENVLTGKKTGLHQKAFCALLYGKYAAFQQREREYDNSYSLPTAPSLRTQ
jgi:hypothetical protein